MGGIIFRWAYADFDLLPKVYRILATFIVGLSLHDWTDPLQHTCPHKAPSRQ